MKHNEINYFSIIKSLIGEKVIEDDLTNVDCYVHKRLGLFIPSLGPCKYAMKDEHTHPAYMIIIIFSNEVNNEHYEVRITSPEVKHNDDSSLDYYCLMIDKKFFEDEYYKYSNEIPKFNNTKFYLCKDILKTLNTFAFENSKMMKNANITLDAEEVIITHWIIRSILGENYDMRSVSDNYCIARVQQYIEQHCSENITVKSLAELINMSSSSFNRLFKKELNISPIEYLIETRIMKAKKLLRRSNLSMTEVAIKCGFSSSSHFAYSFNKLLNITPSEYRKKYDL